MGNWLKRIVIEFIARCIPKHGKRIIYITLCYLIWSNQQDEDTIINQMMEINNRLKLTKNQEALRFAIELRDVLLSADDFRYVKELSPEKMQSQMIRYMPSWLKYDTDQHIEGELRNIWKNQYRLA